MAYEADELDGCTWMVTESVGPAGPDEKLKRKYKKNSEIDVYIHIQTGRRLQGQGRHETHEQLW